MEEDKPVFPPELAHLEEKLSEAKATIAGIDKAIDQLPAERRWRLELTPPGFSNMNQPGTKHAATFQYQQQKNNVRSEYFRDLEADKGKYSAAAYQNIVEKSQSEFEKKNDPQFRENKAGLDKDSSFNHFSEKQDQWSRNILEKKFEFNAEDITGASENPSDRQPNIPDIEPDKD